jgi:lysophospholipase L1-like esterase
LFIDRGIPVIWLEAPQVELGRMVVPRPTFPNNDPERMARFNEVMKSVVADTPGSAFIPLADWLAQQPGGEMDSTLRPDGVHFTPEGAAVVAQWLGPQVIAAGAAARSRL